MNSATGDLDRTFTPLVVRPLRRRDDCELTARGLSAKLFEMVLDHIDYGIACVDDSGGLVHANRVAREAWSLVCPECDPLRNAIRAACTRGLRTLVDVRRAGTRFHVAVVPLSESNSSGGQVLLLLGKSSVCERLSSYWYGIASGLTGAEQSVLEGIAAGWSPRDIAERHGVSLTTIRTQIASVRDKTGSDSIYALLREVAQLPPMRCMTR
jgi:DNA-binding CsgD family transcriptional regulator